jgi:hypothetical protein
MSFCCSSLEGGATIKMTDYGLKPPAAALGTIGTKDEMRIEFRIRLKAQSVISRTFAERASYDSWPGLYVRTIPLRSISTSVGVVLAP